MKTEVAFFDRQRPGAGSLWLVASCAGAGRSVLLRNLSLWLTKSLREDGSKSRSIYWSGEMARAEWEQKMSLLDSEWRRLGIDYELDTWPSTSSPAMGLAERLAGAEIVVVDPLDSILGAGMSLSQFDEHLMRLKFLAARNRCFVIVGVSLPYSQDLSLSLPYSQDLAMEGDVNLLHQFRSPACINVPDVVLVPTRVPTKELSEKMSIRVLKGVDGIGTGQRPGLFELRGDQLVL